MPSSIDEYRYYYWASVAVYAGAPEWTQIKLLSILMPKYTEIEIKDRLQKAVGIVEPYDTLDTGE